MSYVVNGVDIQAFVKAHRAREILGTPRGLDAASEQARRENAFRFTNTVARDLEDGGIAAGILKKPDGVNAFGFSADRLCIIEGTRLHIFDIVRASEATDAGPSFGDDGFVDIGLFSRPDRNPDLLWKPSALPIPPPPQPPTPGPTPGPAPEEPTRFYPKRAHVVGTMAGYPIDFTVEFFDE